MPQSLCKIYLHIIFHVKNDCPRIKEEDQPKLHAFIANLANEIGCYAICIGGINDHVHCLVELSRIENIAHLVEELKRKSSQWIKTQNSNYSKFSWQGGYAAFSVSQSVVDKTTTYIKQQKKHHQHVDFKTEYISFLKTYNIDFNEQYLFVD